MISEATIQAVRELPIEAVIGNYVKLKGTGANMQGLCPFHNEKSPSFYVTPAKGLYYCHGCGAGGDGLKFVMEHEHKTFSEAVEHLAHQHGITLEYEEGNAPDPAVKEKNNNIRKTLAIAANEYHKPLLDAVIASEERAKQSANGEEIASAEPRNDVFRYLTEVRKLTPRTIAQWKLGYADDKNRLSKSLDKATAMEAGIVKESEQYLVPYDFFKNRIIIPITDKNGDVISFGGRKLPTDTNKENPKFINTANTGVYDKSKTLFGLSQAVRSIREQKCAVLVEGYFDVIKLHQWGWTNTVATCGTALTDEHAKLLRRYTDTIIIMRDGDNAGIKATSRDVDILTEHFSDIRICWLHEGVDPDSYFDYWEDADFLTPFTTLEDAFLWKCREELEDAEGDPVFTAAAITACAKLLSKIESQVQREMYVEQLCKEFKIKPKQFKTALTDKLQQESGSLFPDDEIPKWVNLAQFYRDGFIMNNNSQKDRVGIYFKGDSRVITRLTNYVIKPLYFIMDANNPRRLIEVDNGYKKYVIELTNRAFVSQDAFEVEVSGRPGFYSEPGFGKIHYKKLVNWINESTKTVFELKTLGWQPEGFFAYANKVVIPGKAAVDYDEYGIATVNDHHYLSPGVSKMNVDMREGDNIYENDLYLKWAQSPITFEQWAKLFYDVYEEHAAFGIAFIFISAFKDIVTRVAKQPMPYSYGPKGSGKSALGESMMWFFFSGKNSDGKLIQAFNLNPGQGTPFAFFNRMQRFRNVFMLYNEFDPNNIEPWKRGAFKAAYDGEGRETGSGESYKKRKTEIQKMQCVPGIVGQYLDTADDAALMSRSVPFKFSLEKNKARTTEQKAQWEQLNDHEMKGISSLAADLYTHRDLVQSKFKELFWKEQTKLNTDLRKRHYIAEPRVLNNYSVCLAMVRIMGEVVNLPFDYDLFYADCVLRAIDQIKALKDNNILTSFWTMMEVIFDEGFFTNGIHFRIQHNVTSESIKEGSDVREIKFDAPKSILFLRMNVIHDRISKRHREKTGKNFPDEESILTYLKDQAYFIGLCPVKHFSDKKTSAFMIDYQLLEECGVVLEKNQEENTYVKNKQPEPANIHETHDHPL